jgi:hypothetical protein
MAIAAGAILSMIVDTMIPEAFAEAHDYAGVITVLGCLLAFSLAIKGNAGIDPGLFSFYRQPPKTPTAL